MTTLKALLAHGLQRSLGCAVPVTLLLLVVGAAPASAEECPTGSAYSSCGPGWALTGRTFPTNLAPGGSGTIAIDVFNIGAGASEGPVTVTDALPTGVTATEAGERVFKFDAIGHELWDCTGNAPGESPRAVGAFKPATVVTCTNDPKGLSRIPGGGGGPTFANFEPQLQPILNIAVSVRPEAKETSESNRVTIAGGGAPNSASTEDPVVISTAPPVFGLTGWDVWFSNADGTIDTKAGSHPYAATFSFDLASGLKEGSLFAPNGNEFRNLEVELPPGFVGDPTAVPQCTRRELNALECPASSVVGVLDIYFRFGGGTAEKLYNMVPPPGVPGEFAFSLEGINTYLDTTVRTNGEYGLTTHINNNPQREIYQVVTHLWGVPADHTHDRWRINELGGCNQGQIEVGACSAGGKVALNPLLTLPTACSGAQNYVIHASSWQPGEASTKKVQSHDANGNPTGLTGCEDLGFAPLISTAPDTSRADSPAGLTVEVKPPLGGLQDPGGLSTADIENTTVVLPAGLVINPGQAAGLQACQPAQSGVGSEEAPSCPLASKVGTVDIKTPLLEGSAEKELQGNVYILQSNPPHLELLAAASADGVNLKLVGQVSLCEKAGEAIDGKVCEAPGQLITTFNGTPELPFTDFKLSFSGGPQAALATPTQCGTYTTNADFNPWSSPFVPDFLTSAAFALSEGPGGTPCPSNPLPFSPSMTAGATTDQAGGFTNFSLLLQSPDGQQRLGGVQFKAPPGLSAMLSKIPLCPEAQANAGTCPAASQIGHDVAAIGPGPFPLVVPEPSRPPVAIYLTGPYKGAPFGLSIVTRVLTGPFDLGTVVVRATIEVDPHTAQITVTTDPSGPYELPRIIDGIPVDLRSDNAVIDRPGFMFNPTNCSPQAFSGTATSTRGATAPLSSHFQVGSCQSLKFKPDFKVSTSGKTSRSRGASLTARIVYPTGPLGANQASQQANIARVKVDLPKQLPSRLTTLQKACTNTQFEANPAGCPAASKIGMATVTTPLLPVPLEGPAIFVSHGGEAFPSLTMVLQGYGVTVDLVGTTFISKKGITSTTFKTVPDVPFSTFTLTLPQGRFSALAANGNLCKSKLAMPTEFVAQNGAVIHQSTKIGVTGCGKSRKAARHRKRHRAAVRRR